MNFQKNLEKYARLAVSIGAGLKKDQTLIVNAPVFAADLARLVAKIAYQEGASRVLVNYSDDEINKISLLEQADEHLETVTQWKIDGLTEEVKNGAAIVNIISPNPDLLKSVDPKRIARTNKAWAKAASEYRKYVMDGNTCWTIVAYPNQTWAEKVFPALQGEEAITALWEQIFSITRIDQDDPVKAWEKHLNVLNEKMAYLNEKNFDALHYEGEGTDLTVGLAKNHLWIGGGQTSLTGDSFLPNIPTEEVFSVPDKNRVDGILKSTKPLNYSGNLIEDFSFTFKDGKIVDFTAERGEEVLRDLLDTDESARYLGEVALVPHDSPISNTNLIFFNTLFDENASCHFAVGNAYMLGVKDAASLSKEELEARGINESLVHVDFMVGSPSLSITGITQDGERVPVFKDGNWAF